MTILLQTMKEEAYKACVKKVEERIYHAEYALVQAREASNDDTKSSAGDKYETTREMMQQDIARNMQQLQEAQREKQILDSIISPKVATQAELGALLRTDRGIFYLAVSVGAIQLQDHKIFAISQSSPIGQLLRGKKVQETIDFNGIKQQILEII